MGGDPAQMSKTIFAIRHFGLGGRESLETAVNKVYLFVFLDYVYLGNGGITEQYGGTRRQSETPR